MAGGAPPRGRGTGLNPGNRFERLRIVDDAAAIAEMRAADAADAADAGIGLADPTLPEEEPPSPRTVYLKDDSQTMITRNRSPDIGFEFSLNPYRGCEHGCAYCYARPYHEFLGMNAGLDFESKIVVKREAPALLEREFYAPKWRGDALVCSGVTDPYQPVEKSLKITRGCLEVLLRFRNPVAMITKNHLVTRDVDLLGELARDHEAAKVFVSLPTLDPGLARILEPRASSPAMRLDAIEVLAGAGVPVGVSLAPTIPGLNEHEIPAILGEAAARGAREAFYTIVRLPHGVAEIFEDWLDRHLPEGKERILGRIREVRHGKLNASNFGERMTGSGPLAGEIESLFEVSRRRYGFNRGSAQLSSAGFQRPGSGRQLELFE